MRLRTDHLLLVFLVPLALAGCGSHSSYAGNTRAAISKMESTLRSYNQDRPASLPDEATLCRSTMIGLQSVQRALVQKPAPAQYRTVSSAVRQAYALARKAFSDCAAAARGLNYPLMTQAEHEVAQANGWIALARRADH